MTRFNFAHGSTVFDSEAQIRRELPEVGHEPAKGQISQSSGKNING